MESLAYTLLALLFAWRVLLSLGVAALLAWVLFLAVPAFTVGYGLALALLGLVFGVIWQARAEAGVGLFERTEPVRVFKACGVCGPGFYRCALVGRAVGAQGSPLVDCGAVAGSPFARGLVVAAADSATSYKRAQCVVCRRVAVSWGLAGCVAAAPELSA